MQTKTVAFLMAAMIGGTFAATAHAMPLSGTAPAQTAVPAIQLVQDGPGMGEGRKLRQERRYNRRAHGDRCRYRGDGCRHYYNGWYYGDRWWLGSGIVGGIVIGDNDFDDDDYDDYVPSRRLGRRHINWCEDRYQSYNPRTNRWLSYSGRYRQCVSPFS